MTASTINKAQRNATRVVGFTYLFAAVTAAFAEFYVMGTLIVPDDAAETARNIVANERLFRLGIASYLMALVADVALITALYVILRHVDQDLALFAALMRVVETAILAAATLNSFDVLRLLGGADYLQAFTADQLQALARIPIGAYSAGHGVGYVFLGVGSTVFGYLWFKSNYIPRALAALGVLGSLLFATGSLAVVVFPDLSKTATLGMLAPLGLFEVTMGFWLLSKGLRPPGTGGPDKAGDRPRTGSA